MELATAIPPLIMCLLVTASFDLLEVVSVVVLNVRMWGWERGRPQVPARPWGAREGGGGGLTGATRDAIKARPWWNSHSAELSCMLRKWRPEVTFKRKYF